jgi:uncharacterized protein (DUF1919 family)
MQVDVEPGYTMPSGGLDKLSIVAKISTSFETAMSKWKWRQRRCQMGNEIFCEREVVKREREIVFWEVYELFYGSLRDEPRRRSSETAWQLF